MEMEMETEGGKYRIYDFSQIKLTKISKKNGQTAFFPNSSVGVG